LLQIFASELMSALTLANVCLAYRIGDGGSAVYRTRPGMVSFRESPILPYSRL
jgi:hypothetical protein